MTIEEKIKDAARIHAHLKENFDLEDELYYNSTGMNAYESFQLGVKSEVAKEYWQQEMYTKEEIYEMLKDCDSEGGLRWDEVDRWFEQNKKK